MSCPATSSGLKSADTAILVGPGKLRGLQVLADGTNAATVVIYDNPSAASGTILAKVTVDATLTEASAGGIPSEGVWALTGLYADVTGTGAEFIVYYDKG